MEEMERIIRKYIEAYNKLDVNGMLVHLHSGIRFKNISDGVVTLALHGIEEF